MRSYYLSPLVNFTSIWIVVAFLYSLNLSRLLIFSLPQVLLVIGLILIPFFIGYIYSSLIIRLCPKKSQRLAQNEYRNNDYLLRTKVSSFGYFLLVIAEIAYSGGIPLLLMIKGSSISHFDFGLPVLHGFVLAFGSILATANFYFFLRTRNSHFGFTVFLIIVTFILMVTRKMIVVSCLQMLVVYFLLVGRPRFRTVLVVFLWVIFVIFIFGWIGDIRTGRDLFLRLARTNFDYPSFLPTGFIWVYVYLVTPVLNFTNAVLNLDVMSANFDFLCSMLPSALRETFDCLPFAEGQFERSFQVSPAFNVATGYITIYLSQSIPGVVIFSFLHGGVSAIAYKLLSDNFARILFFAVLTQINLLMIFGNGFLNLNVLFQFPLIVLIFLFRSRSNACDGQ